MAGFLYLPRLFVYHCQAARSSPESETFKVMERRLLRAIMNPAMVVAWAAGLALMVNVEAWTEAWFHAKATAVIVLTVLHMTAARWRRDFAADANRHSERFYRIMNEVPELLMVAIVIRSEENTSELQSLMRNSYAGYCLKNKTKIRKTT